MTKKRRTLWLVVAGLLFVIVIGLLALPALVDVNRYRGLIETKAREALGREVRLGEMKLSVLPVLGVRVDDISIGALPGEGAGDLLEADSLRVGARLMPLLRGRLEVTSLVLDRPAMRIERGSDGAWNISRLMAPEGSDRKPGSGDQPAGTTGAGTKFQISSLRIRDGRIVLRDAGPGRKQPLEVTLTGLDLRVKDLSPDKPVGVDLTAGLEGVPGARIRLAGSAGPLSPAEGEVSRIEGEIDVRKLDAAKLGALLGPVAPLPPELVGPRPFSLEAELSGQLAPEPQVSLSGVTIRDIELRLRRTRDGAWNLPDLDTGGPKPKGKPSGMKIALSGLAVSDAAVHIKDETGEGEPLDLTLDPLRLTLDRLPTEGRAAIDLEAAVSTTDGRGDLAIKGHLGPIAGDGGGGALPAELAVRFDRIPATLLRRFLGGSFTLGGRKASGDLKADISGALPDRLDAKGTFEIAGAEVSFSGADGRPRTAPLDLATSFDVSSRKSGSDLDIRSLRIDSGGNRLELRGSMREEGPFRRIDMELLPAKVRADDLTALLVMVSGEPPVSFSSAAPIELQVRARGLVGEGRMPNLEGSAKLREATLNHPSMDQPLERLDADVALRGETVDVNLLNGAVGSSDIAGTISVKGFDPPRIGFDLTSDRADFGELFSFMKSEEGASGPSKAGAGGQASPELAMGGRIRIQSGSFQTLDFENLDATLDYSSGMVTVEPVSLGLYGGSFRGRIVSDLTKKKPTYEVQGAAEGVDTDAFLTDNLESAGMLTGRFSGKVGVRGSGVDYETIVRGLTGKGEMEVADGKIGKLDVLGRLSKVSGMFGETTLKSLTRSVAKEGTAFSRLTSGLRLQGGKMAFEDLLLDSPQFRLQGDGAIDLLTNDLRGEFRLKLSPELSEMMRAENSRAAQVFWNSRKGHVEFPFTLAGPFNAPTPGVDIQGAVRTAVKDKADDKARSLIGEKLGLKPRDTSAESGREETAESQPTSDRGTTARSGLSGTEAARTAPAAPETDLRGEVSDVEWSGSMLAPDLRLKGRISGTDIKRASLRITDARNVEIEEIDQLDEVKKYKKAGGGEAALTWKESIDGKKLLAAKFPLSVTLTITNQAGQSVETIRQVNR
jgi:uncharacterized protein involved in outer membrane biogenesis